MIPDKFALVAATAIINSYQGKYGRVNAGLFQNQTTFKVGHADGVICEYGNLLVVCFRGSNGKADWADNFDFSPSNFGDDGAKVHHGFMTQYLAVKALVDRAILLKKKVIICGHSLGGAIATIIAYKLAIGNPRKIIMCVTWGSPRVGNRKFASNFKRFVPNSLRFVNLNDVVARVPFSWLFKYSHVGAKIRVGSKRFRINRIIEKIFGSIDDHRPDSYLIAVKQWANKRSGK